MNRRLREKGSQVLGRLGFPTTRVLPGALLVSRRPAPRIRQFAEGRVLLSRERAARSTWQQGEAAMTTYLAEQHVAGVLRMYRVNVVLDVGANRGQFGSRLRRAGYRGQIISFEPVAGLFAQLEERAASDPKWSVHRCALGREDGTIAINVVPGTLSSVLAPTGFGANRYAQLRAPTTEEVPVRRLDGMLDELLADVPDPRPYLKLDTQGFDLEAFAGLGQRVNQLVGMQSEVAIQVIYEGMPRITDSLPIYEAAGFEISGLFAVSRETRTARVVEYDCVMVRTDAL